MKIKLNNDTSIDLDKLIESRLLIQANSGGGKSWAIRRIIEQAFGHVQIIIIDPEGEFGNLRSKYDFAYVGKEGDVPAESRSAALLARRLLELKASAIIDLYELPSHERKHFVRLFCDAMVNAPKELWHDVLVIIDECHIFAPEKGESEALGPVTDLATRGRKRGYCAVLATQRLSKLNKDVAAECNNKLIGRASQDIDRKRAGEELGFTSKEDVLSLRNVEPGEFYVFGPAIGRDVEKIEIGDVLVKPAKRGVSKAKPPAASPVVKKILAQLKDLPQEAQKEAQTIGELHRELIAAKREIARLGRQQPAKELAPMGVSQWANYGKKYAYWQFFEKEAVEREQKAFHALKEKIKMELFKTHGNIGKLLELVGHVEGRGKPLPDSHAHATKEHRAIKRTPPMQGTQESLPSPTLVVGKRDLEAFRQLKYNPVLAGGVAEKPGAGEMKILAAVASHEEGMTREHITIVTGYKQSTRNAYIQRLYQKGFVGIGEMIKATETGLAELGPNFERLPEGSDLVEHYVTTLPEGESKILRVLLNEIAPVSREQISEETGFKPSTRNAYIQRLTTRRLVEVRPDGVKVSDHLQF